MGTDILWWRTSYLVRYTLNWARNSPPKTKDPLSVPILPPKEKGQIVSLLCVPLAKLSLPCIPPWGLGPPLPFGLTQFNVCNQLCFVNCNRSVMRILYHKYVISPIQKYPCASKLESMLWENSILREVVCIF